MSLCVDDCTEIDENAISLIGAMTTLRSLSLRNVNVAPLSLCALRPLKDLRELAVGSLATDRLLQDISAAHLNLVSLEIPLSRVTAIGLSSLSSISTLAHITIGGCDYISDTIKEAAAMCAAEKLFTAGQKRHFFSVCSAEAALERERQEAADTLARRARALSVSHRSVELIVENTFRLLGKRCRPHDTSASPTDAPDDTVIKDNVDANNESMGVKTDDGILSDYNALDWVRPARHIVSETEQEKRQPQQQRRQ